MPDSQPLVSIDEVYGKEVSHQVINSGFDDYNNHFRKYCSIQMQSLKTPNIIWNDL